MACVEATPECLDLILAIVHSRMDANLSIMHATIMLQLCHQPSQYGDAQLLLEDGCALRDLPKAVRMLAALRPAT